MLRRNGLKEIQIRKSKTELKGRYPHKTISSKDIKKPKGIIKMCITPISGIVHITFLITRTLPLTSVLTPYQYTPY